MKVLILEDESARQGNYAIYAATECGYEVAVGRDGTFLQSNWPEVESCDVIVIDYKMPGMDGLASLKFLSEMGWSKPVLLHHESIFDQNYDLRTIRQIYPFATFRRKQWDGYSMIRFLEKNIP